MSVARDLPVRIVVAGQGQVGLITAIALRKALPICEVIIVGTPLDASAIADSIGTSLPFTNNFHTQLQIQERNLIREVGASHRLVTRYFGWGGPDSEYTACYGYGFNPVKSSLDQNSSDSQKTGSTTISELLAKENRFSSETLPAEFDYALRWNVEAYRNHLISHAMRIGVSYIESPILDITADDKGGILAVTLKNSVKITADFFFDCTGSSASLFSKVTTSSWIDWSDILPVRSLWRKNNGPVAISLEDRVTLTPIGLLSEMVGRDGISTILACPQGVDEASIHSVLGPDFHKISLLMPGRQSANWIGNVISLGDASARFEPLAGLNIDLAHRQLGLFLELLPGRIINAGERDEYNRRSALMADQTCNVLAAHYLGVEAQKVFGDTKKPENVTLILDQFKRHGRVPFLEEMPLQTAEWASLLLALNVSAGRRKSDLTIKKHADNEQMKQNAVMACPKYTDWMIQILD
jgi:tryptophan 7-halogenase